MGFCSGWSQFSSDRFLSAVKITVMKRLKYNAMSFVWSNASLSGNSSNNLNSLFRSAIDAAVENASLLCF